MTTLNPTNLQSTAATEGLVVAVLIDRFHLTLAEVAALLARPDVRAWLDAAIEARVMVPDAADELIFEHRAAQGDLCDDDDQD